ncbi:Peptide N-acetyl-beta-D-glucosaminyl asparaginase amidase A [Musa troglodytarum]|uniref:Peptide N-acetyl-beta-D-glucosaminyl asparaginase amidase A n=1 Tax=Musa troglodytarum TaxID=320322 RepID=A0A9E7HZE7_9LILI|nr:Peptide N-acetyl-beta-D-glucosaminyl asparaginase amidase A [Musa troglodytarum]
MPQRFLQLIITAVPPALPPTNTKTNRSGRHITVESSSYLMAATSPLLLRLLFLSLTFHFGISGAHLHRSKLTTSEDEQISVATTAAAGLPPFSPTTFFEVTKPVPLPRGDEPACSTLLLQHDFGFTYGKPPVTASYRPPCSRLRRSRVPSRAVLEWSAACQGRQFDRIFGVWLGGVELLRSCTAEPRATGIVWTVRKDVTRYASLFARPQTLAIYLGNLVDQTYTGVYHVNVSLHFFFDSSRHHRHPRASAAANRVPGFASPANLVLPISRSLPLNDGLWFSVQNSTDIQSTKLAIPTNTYRAVLEVYVSFHSADEFWYTNPPDIYISENNLTDLPGNGPFREVTARLDGEIVGAIWPFTVIYTGGVNPLLWRPISGIGSFDLPSYSIEITPFLGKILDGQPHEFGFGVTDALNVWYIDANLHLWLDDKSSYTLGSLIKYEAPGYAPSLDSQFKGLDGRFKTSASRYISSTGWVRSSYGKITTRFFQKLQYENLMVFSGNGSVQMVNQTIDFNYGTYAKHPSSVLYSEHVHGSFPLYLYTGTVDQGNDTFAEVANVSLGFNEKKLSGEKYGFTYSSLKNLQTGSGDMRVKGNLVQSGIASTQQVYKYESTDGCYYRNVRSRNYTVLYDKSEEFCTKNSPSDVEYIFT